MKTDKEEQRRWMEVAKASPEDRIPSSLALPWPPEGTGHSRHSAPYGAVKITDVNGCPNSYRCTWL